MEAASTQPITTEQTRRWPLFLFGVLVFFLGPIVYSARFMTGHLEMPWYLLILVSAGVLLMAVSVWQRRGIFRSIGLVVFAGLAGCFWYFLIVASKTPDYVGPAQPGNKFPAFTIAFADGRTFSNSDLETGDRAVLLFFRGRW